MTGSDDELQERTCRACDRSYKYPAPRSQATRSYCEECAALPVGVRAILELHNKRIRSLAAAIDKLQSGNNQRP